MLQSGGHLKGTGFGDARPCEISNECGEERLRVMLTLIRMTAMKVNTVGIRVR